METHTNDLSKYNACSSICGKVYRELVSKIQDEGVADVHVLETFGTKRIHEELQTIYKKESFKGLAFPVSINIGNCVGNHLSLDEKTNVIQDSDIVKIELGVHVSGSAAMYANTIVKGHPEGNEYTRLLQDLVTLVNRNMKHLETNDELRIAIEAACTDHDCFPVENTYSYQAPRTMDSKYIVLNHKKYYDEDDELVGDGNLCFEFEQDEMYHVNIAIVPNVETGPCVYKEHVEPKIFRFNDYHYQFKLKSAREFYSNVTKKHGNFPFNVSEFLQQPKDKLGMRECLNSGVLEALPIVHCQNAPVYNIQWTAVVRQNKALSLKYT